MATTKFVTDDGLKEVLTAVKGRLDKKVHIVESADDLIYVDNSDPMNPLIGLDEEVVEKIDALYNEIFPTREDTPTANIDFIEECLESLDPDTTYIINNVSIVSSNTGTISLLGSWFGKNIKVIKVSTSSETEDSLPQNIFIPSRPVLKGVTVEHETDGLANGEIKGLLEGEQEWKLVSDVSWTDVSFPMNFFAAGDYQIRIKAVIDLSFASLPVTVSIQNLIGSEEPEEPVDDSFEMTYSFPSSVTAPNMSSTGKIPFESWTGYDSQVIDDDDIYELAESYLNSEEFPYKLYAKYVTDVEEKLVWFDQWGGDPGFTGNMLRSWMIGPGYIAISGSNATGGNIELRFVYEGSE